MRYLVTGGSGFIGSHLVDHLTQLGHTVVNLDVAPPLVTTGDWIQGSVTDPAALGDALRDGCDGIFHLAAIVGFARVMRDPITTILANTHGTETVLRCAAMHDVPVLLTSTSAVYGRATNGGAPVSESMDGTLGPSTTTSWCYAYAKAADEALAFAYARQHRLPVIVVRLFNTVGPRQSADAGFVLPRFVHAALQGAPLEVHRPGTQARTFGHVRDITRALAQLMDCPDARGQLVNVGGTATIPIADLATYVIRTLGSPSPMRLVEAPYQSYDNVRERRPDLRKLQGLLGWLPATPLEIMIRDVAACG